MTNPIMNIINMMRAGGNPGQIISNVLSRSIGNNPAAKNVLDMAQKGDIKGIENFARNVTKSRGIDFDTAFKEFRDKFGL